jgi:hypothetical protein
MSRKYRLSYQTLPPDNGLIAADEVAEVTGSLCRTVLFELSGSRRRARQVSES